jgi:hypothetical protein
MGDVIDGLKRELHHNINDNGEIGANFGKRRGAPYARGRIGTNLLAVTHFAEFFQSVARARNSASLR